MILWLYFQVVPMPFAIAARTDGVLVVAHKNIAVSDINMINEQLKCSGAEVVVSVLIDF